MADRDEDFEEVFRALLPRALRVARRILGSAEEAEDAAAEAFARAHAAWWRIRHLPHRDAWILRVTTNVAIDTIRRRRHLPAELPVAMDHGEQTVLRMALVAALSELPRRQREVIVLRFLEDMNEREVASCLHVSVGTVKKATHRAMAALQDRFGEQAMPALEDAR